MNERKIVEINGVKLEIDLREAKSIESYRVGTCIKLLKKQYSDSWGSYPGVVVGFDPFKNLPTIIIAYLKSDYNGATIEWCYLNAESKDVEICPADNTAIPFEEGRVIELLDRQILESEKKTEDLKLKKEYFLSNFNKYFKEIKD